MATTKTAKYKRFNGTDWDTIHFETDATVVSPSTAKHFVTTSTKINGVAFTLDSSDGAKSSVTIYATDIAVSSSDTTTVNAYITDLSSRLGTLESAYTGGGSGSILTTENYSTTLGSVYQAKDEDLTAIAGLTGTSGFLKKTAANTWSLDTTTYATPANITTAIAALDGTITGTAGAGKTLTALSETDGKIAATFADISITKSQVSDFPTTLKNPSSLSFGSNSYDGSAAKTIYADNTYMSSSDTTTVKSYIDTKVSEVNAVAAGKTKTYILSYADKAPTSDDFGTYSTYTYYKYDGTKINSLSEFTSYTSGYKIANSQFNSQGNTDAITEPIDSTYAAYIVLVNESTNEKIVVKSEDFASFFNVGDVILIEETDVPDRWYAGAALFYKMETAKVDVSIYAQKTTTVSSNDTDAGVKVTLGGTVNAPTVDVAVTGGSVASGNTSVVTGGTVYNVTKDLAPKNNPTFTGTVTMPVTSGLLKVNASGVVSADTNTYLTAHPSVTKSDDTTPSGGTLTHGGTFTAVTGITRDSYGHVTTIATKTYTLPGSGDTDAKTSSTASTGEKIYIVGAASQSSSGQTTKSNVNCYVGTDNCLYSNANRVPTIFYSDTVPTSGMVTGDICIEY